MTHFIGNRKIKSKKLKIFKVVRQSWDNIYHCVADIRSVIAEYCYHFSGLRNIALNVLICKIKLRHVSFINGYLPTCNRMYAQVICFSLIFCNIR